jgi:LmbE family N-acetylglucosaminyl deacetylase
VVPHPDDEVLSTGGLIALQRRRGVHVVVVAVTDGEAAYPSHRPAALAERRRREQQNALDVLGVSPSDVVRCALPDGRVPEHTSALADVLLSVLRPNDVLVGPWVRDHHSDHVACGETVSAIGRAKRLTTLGSLFWAYHYTDPTDTPTDISTSSFLNLRLDQALVRARDVALLAHESQMPGGDGDSILNDGLLASLRRPSELYVSVT